MPVSERAVETEDFEFGPVEIHEQVNETHVCSLEFRQDTRGDAFLERGFEYECEYQQSWLFHFPEAFISLVAAPDGHAKRCPGRSRDRQRPARRRGVR